MRRTFTAEEKASVFELWKNGTGFSEIANILGSKPGTIFTMLRDTGGIKPHERKRAVAHLTLSEREEIRAGLSAKMSIRAIATALNRSPSTISREVQRNRGRRYYKAVDANNRANRMAKRPKPCLLDQNLPLRKLVLEKLEMKWSPEQISGWLRRTKPRQKTVAEALQDTLTPEGLVGIMSSGQASLTNNTTGGLEVYRASKAALNQFMRSYAIRQSTLYPNRAFLLLAPGWIRTDMGGSNGAFSLEEAIPDIIKTIEQKQGKPGLEYLDRFGKTIPW
ncbi:hypothetical protein GEO08_09495 [Escherichia coli]|nr:hypothetical protein [Escherichia coli]